MSHRDAPLTDNGSCYRCTALPHRAGARGRLPICSTPAITTADTPRSGESHPPATFPTRGSEQLAELRQEAHFMIEADEITLFEIALALLRCQP